MSDEIEQRPELTARRLTGAELQRWYWLRSELADLARQMRISPSGSKQELTARLALALDGVPVPVPNSSRRRTPARQLTGPVDLATVIPVGQRSSQLLREFFQAQIGSGFRFDGAMRAFITNNPGQTLGDAVAYWHTSRSHEQKDIEPQFELNRFTRQWHLDHPGSSRVELLQAWADYRSRPVDDRPRA